MSPMYDLSPLQLYKVGAGIFHKLDEEAKAQRQEATCLRSHS